MKKGFFNSLIFFSSLIFFCPVTYSQDRSAKANQAGEFLAHSVHIADELAVFDNGETMATYRISLCADVPNDKKPWKVAYRQETGHVFLILQKISGIDTISKVFGFYPKRGLPVLFFKKITSQIKDNSKRVYDVDVTKELSAVEFDTVLTRCIVNAQQVYHINKFNCYDYAVGIFNSIADEHPLPVRHIRFPLIFGKGGSPCAVYQDLQQVKANDPVRASCIRFGSLMAPSSTLPAKAKDQ